MAKITIVKTSLNYTWRPMELNIGKIEAHGYMVNENWAADEGCLLLMTETARREMFEFIQWKNLKTQDNRNEQGGLMAGIHCSVPGYEGKVCIVQHVFPLHEARSTTGYLDASAADWSKAYARMDQLSAQLGERLEPLGWFHTHPNDLPTFMSGTDRFTQGKVFSGEYSYALVLNPHTGSWKAFRDKDAHDACCVMMDTDDLTLLCGAEPEKKPFAMKKGDGKRLRRRNIEKAKRRMRARGAVRTTEKKRRMNDGGSQQQSGNQPQTQT